MTPPKSRRQTKVPTKISEIPHAWANWFTGLCDGEGSFSSHPEWEGKTCVTPSFSICMQQDDELLNSIEGQLGVGTVSPRVAKDGRHAGSSWIVNATDELVYLCNFFDAFPLRSKKQLEFQHWRVLVEDYQTRARPFAEVLAHALALSELFERRKGPSKRFQIRARAFLDHQHQP
ncbi:MAG: LAGLIDADG family homing endonuclease [Verrucomicrobiota bacterium]